jgi:TRAP-type C4-dicarboxylate transport system substrate-binding protein
MRKMFPFIIFGMMVLLGAGTLFAQRGSSQAGSLEVKIGSPLPRESPWGRTLDRIAAEWSRITNGQVRLNVRHGGIEGNETKMHLSLASDAIQAAIFTSFGLKVIDPAVMTLSAPFLIRNERELSAVMRELQPELEARLNKGNHFMLAWSKAGFVNIFSKDPVVTPDDLRKQKIASNPEASDLNLPFKFMNFQIVEMEWSEAGNKLNAGVVTAAYQNPAAIAAFQLHTILKNMMSTNIAPVLGGIVMNQVTWKKIGDLNPRYQQELLTATRRIAEEFDNSLQKTVSDAVQSMSRAGLKVNQPTAAQEQLWYNDIEKAIPNLLGTAFDRDLYQRVTEILTRFRGGR